jgi:hypothetical protein
MSRLTATVTQGGADAFAQAEMATALTGIKGTAYQVLELSLEFILPALSNFPVQAAAAQRLDVCITRRTKSAMPNISDVDVIHKFSWSAIYQTAAGWSPIFNPVSLWVPQGEVLVVEDPLYLQIDSTATTGTWSAVVNLEYEVKKISDIDRLSLLTLSLG